MLRTLFPGSRRLLLDANLLVILVVGQVRKEIFGKSPVSDYRDSDFDLLFGLMSEFTEVITTPYILAEVNMLLTKTGKYYSVECRAALSNLVPGSPCSYDEPAILSVSPYFASFGISDISIMQAALTNTVVLTSDGNLAGLLRSNKQSVMLYKELKQIYGLP